MKSRKTSPSHPQWSYRCRAVKLQRRWCVRTGKSPEVWVHLVYTPTRYQHSHPATGHEGNLLLYTARRRNAEGEGLIMLIFILLIMFFFLYPHLHIKQSRPIAGPLLNDAHVFKHGLVLRHALQTGPLLQNTCSRGRSFLLDPHLQHLLLLRLK